MSEIVERNLDLRCMKIGRGDAAQGHPYTVPTGQTVTPGDVVEPFGPTGRCSFAHPDNLPGKGSYAPGETLTLIHSAKFALGTRAIGSTFSAGAPVFWDRTNRVFTSTATGNRRCGIALGPGPGRYGDVPAAAVDDFGIPRVFFEFNGDLT